MSSIAGFTTVTSVEYSYKKQTLGENSINEIKECIDLEKYQYRYITRLSVKEIIDKHKLGESFGIVLDTEEWFFAEDYTEEELISELSVSDEGGQVTFTCYFDRPAEYTDFKNVDLKLVIENDITIIDNIMRDTKEIIRLSGDIFLGDDEQIVKEEYRLENIGEYLKIPDINIITTTIIS